MSRLTLPSRRAGTRIKIEHAGHKYHVTINSHEGKVAEVFCNSPKVGSGSQAWINDCCIILSLLLQHGMTIGDIAKSLGENRDEGKASGPPSSPLGAIARAGTALELEKQSVGRE